MERQRASARGTGRWRWLFDGVFPPFLVEPADFLVLHALAIEARPDTEVFLEGVIEIRDVGKPHADPDGGDSLVAGAQEMGGGAQALLADEVADRRFRVRLEQVLKARGTQADVTSQVHPADA